MIFPAKMDPPIEMRGTARFPRVWESRSGSVKAGEMKRKEKMQAMDTVRKFILNRDACEMSLTNSMKER